MDATYIASLAKKAGFFEDDNDNNSALASFNLEESIDDDDDDNNSEKDEENNEEKGEHVGLCNDPEFVGKKLTVNRVKAKKDAIDCRNVGRL